jgi:hypothetical protein
MLAGPDEEVERVSVLQGLESGREQIGAPLLQVILVNKSNDVAFFVIGIPAYRVILIP